jgi:hypothetical protein
MKPEELAAYRKVIEDLTGRDRLASRLVEEQRNAYSSKDKLIAESMLGLRVRAAQSAVEEMVRLATHRNRPEVFNFVGRTQVEELVRKMVAANAFNLDTLTARGAVAAQIKSINALRQRIDPEIIASFRRSSTPDTVASLSAVFAERLRTLEQFHSGFAQTMTQTLKTAFEGLEKRNKESLTQLEKSIGEKIGALPDKIQEPVWVRAVNALIALVTIAGVVIAFAQFLDSKEQSKVMTAFVIEATKTLQQIATNTAKQPDTYYEVKRSVTLKMGPDNRSATLATIPRTAEVLLISRKHKWIFVAYTDSSGTSWGWVSKKYLKKID